jgi:hypothetical protein
MVNVSSGEATNKRQTTKHFDQNKQCYQASISSSKRQAKQVNSRTATHRARVKTNKKQNKQPNKTRGKQNERSDTTIAELDSAAFSIDQAGNLDYPR